MPTSTRQPSYRHHRPSGQAVVTLDGKDIYLGRFGTPESKAEYDRRIAEWLTNGPQLPRSEPASISVAGLIKQYWVTAHYRHPDGTPTSEVGEYRYSLRPLNHLYGSTPGAEFGPLAFKAVRQLLVTGYAHPTYGEQRPQSRGVINKRMDRVRRMFKWGVENEIIPRRFITACLQSAACSEVEAMPERPNRSGRCPQR